MSSLSKLKAASSLHDLAILLNYTPASLSYLVYKRPAKYTQFPIPKRDGTERIISAPCEELKALQKRVKKLLYECLECIDKISVQRGSIAHGFKKGHSIATNADVHRKRRYVFNVDIQGFFDSIHMGRIRGFLITNKDFELHPKVATVLAQIMCHDNKLPQGSPTSPIASNFIGHLLDLRLAQLAKKTGCTYSRYADDLTFSTNHSFFPSEIAENVGGGSEWSPGSSLLKVIEKSGFSLNPKKTRMQFHIDRQSVTGLVVNQITNSPVEMRRTVRAMAHSLFKNGYYHVTVEPTLPKKKKKREIKDYTKLATLDGLFSFIYMIDQFNRNKIVENSNIKLESIKRTSLEMIHGDFLFYKYFYASPCPTIVCEGKTDNIYLTCAMKSLKEKFPRLCKTDKEGKEVLKVRFVSYSNLTHRVLDLNGGSPDLAALIRSYAKNCAKYEAHPPLHPTIIVVDNDSGSEPIFKAIKDTTGNKYAIPKGKGTVLDKTRTTYYIAQNLCVVLTPLKAGGEQSMMEDFFHEKTLKREWDGKKFEILSKGQPQNVYSKNIFATKIVKADRANIEFDLFTPILSSISQVIKNHPKVKKVAMKKKTAP